MTLHKYLLALTVFFFPIITKAQQKYSFKKILEMKAVNKTFVNKSKEDTTWRTYLGSLKNDKNETLFFVIKEFDKIKAASTWHGHSNVYFFNRKGKIIARLDVALPENLPLRIQKDILYFPDDKISGTVHAVKIGRSLPPDICLKPDWCDEVIFL